MLHSTHYALQVPYNKTSSSLTVQGTEMKLYFFEKIFLEFVTLILRNPPKKEV